MSRGGGEAAIKTQCMWLDADNDISKDFLFGYSKTGILTASDGLPRSRPSSSKPSPFSVNNRYVTGTALPKTERRVVLGSARHQRCLVIRRHWTPRLLSSMEGQVGPSRRYGRHTRARCHHCRGRPLRLALPPSVTLCSSIQYSHFTRHFCPDPRAARIAQRQCCCVRSGRPCGRHMVQKHLSRSKLRYTISGETNISLPFPASSILSRQKLMD